MGCFRPAFRCELCRPDSYRGVRLTLPTTRGTPAWVPWRKDMNHFKFVTLLGSTFAAVALCVCGAVHAADESKGPRVSDFLLKPLQAAQDAMKAQNWDLEIS